MTRNERIISMVQNGMSYREVAEGLGITRSAVAGVCCRADLYMSPEQAAKNRQRAHGERVPGRMKKARKLRSEGLSYDQIADLLGYARQSSAYYAVNHGKS